MVQAIVGANWGDEGKGKITDYLAESADVVVRFQGGANAGHTIINPYGRFSLHLLPSGVFNPNVTCVLGNGVAVDIGKFLAELKSLEEAGVPKPKIYISDRAQVMLPHHVLQDTYEEERLGKNSFGSTKSGIAPFFSDKYAKIGLQFNELYFDDILEERLKKILEIKNAMFINLYGKEPLDFNTVLVELKKQREEIKPFLKDTSLFLRTAIKEGKKILLEGQLGTMKDPDHGIYPMVTSSHTLASYGAVGTGIPPYAITDVVCVTKAYSSAVGAGEFVSELFGEAAEELRKRGGDKGEYGATTGRPRRVGWYDAVASRYGCALQGATQVALTVLDPLGYLDEIPICTGYEIDGEVIRDFPVTPLLRKAKPVYTVMKGWKQDIRGIRKYEDLPKECRDYIDFIEKELEVPITMVSNGPKREEILLRTPKL